MTTDDEWLKVPRTPKPPTPPPKVEPVSKQTLAAYAHRLREGDSSLSRKEAKALAEKHEHQRRQGPQPLTPSRAASHVTTHRGRRHHHH
jgi:hypothetical protein